jgi:hypothetical protein
MLDAGSIAIAQADDGFTTSATGRHAAPHSALDAAGVAVALLLVVLVTVKCVRLFLRPGERQDDHIKRRVLDLSPSSGQRPRGG